MVLAVKNPAAKAGDRDTGLIPGSGRSPGGGHGNPLQYSCLENPMSLAGYSPWGHKDFNTIGVTVRVHICMLLVKCQGKKEDWKGGEIDHPHFN